jgi:transcriptional regulator with XRE-family HTH domain
MKHLGKKIKSLRQQKDWTQEDIAKQLGISIPAFSKIETGITDINLSRIEQIAKLFNLSVVQLFTLYEGEELPSHISEIETLNQKLHERDKEIFTLQKKLIELHEKSNN